MPELADVYIRPSEFFLLVVLFKVYIFDEKSSFPELSSSFSLDLAFPLLFVLHDFCLSAVLF